MSVVWIRSKFPMAREKSTGTPARRRRRISRSGIRILRGRTAVILLPPCFIDLATLEHRTTLAYISKISDKRL